MKIEAYSFGCMKIDGTEYRSDVIVFPDKVKSGWWRQEGHSLSVADLGEVIEFGPEVLIVGTGASGIMDVPASTVEALREKGIEVVAATTGEAWRLFNEYIRQGKNVVGAFHLTC
jgi:hypothetical protein